MAHNTALASASSQPPGGTRITGHTSVCGIFGHPVGHSLSPSVHNAAFEHAGLDFVYVAHDVTPEDLSVAIAGARAMGYRGLSITVPHKLNAMYAVDDMEPTAQAIGCINTIVNESGKLTGHNSDGRGALNALVAANADPRDQHVVLVGSGGAARALAMTIAREAPPRSMTILGVDAEQLATLVSAVRAAASVEVEGREATPENIVAATPDAALLLHCTPVGMHPREGQSAVPRAALHDGLCVFDAVYNPRRTQLLTDAAEVGCKIVEGLEMFLGQAIVQYELWTGHKAPVDVMRRVVEARL